MEIKARSGTETEKKYSKKLIPIINRHHFLLVTVMLWNASATEALPIFLNQLVPEYLAIIISVTLVLFVGEIIPAAILTGPKQLEITASLAPLVYIVMAIFFPLAYPISLILDCVIGHDSGITTYNRREISTMMRLQREEGMKRVKASKKPSNGLGSSNSMYQRVSEDIPMEEEEVAIIDGALKYREMSVSEVMTPEERAYMIPVTEKLSYKVRRRLMLRLIDASTALYRLYFLLCCYLFPGRPCTRYLSRVIRASLCMRIVRTTLWG